MAAPKLKTTTVTTRTNTRQFQRMPLCRRVNVSLPDWSKLRVWGHDISRGGIKLSLPSNVAPGDCVDINLTLPNDVQLDLKAEVRFALADSRPGECRVGLCWVDPAAGDMELLQALLDDVAHQAPPVAQPNGPGVERLP